MMSGKNYLPFLFTSVLNLTKSPGFNILDFFLEILLFFLQALNTHIKPRNVKKFRDRLWNVDEFSGKKSFYRYIQSKG